MAKRLAIIGGAAVLAVGVLLATLLSGTPSVTVPKSGSGSTPPPPPPAQPGLTEDDLANVPSRPEASRIEADQYHVEQLNKGKLWQFWGDRVTPLPQGLTRVDKPGMRVHLERWRVLQITADKGTFVAPNNQPRSGDYEGQVVVTVFESPDDQRPDMSDSSPHIQLKLYLDDAAFDVELGQIDSAGQVHLTGPGVDFVGRGLRVNYNERRNRIERLEVHEGQVLRLKPDVLAKQQQIEQARPDEPEATAAQSATAAPPSAQRERQREHDDDDEVDDRPQRSEDAQQRRRDRAQRQRERERQVQAATPRGPQFYRATFERDVHIVSPQADITAAAMQLVFSMDGNESQEAPAVSPPTTPATSQTLRPRPRHFSGEAPTPLYAHLLALQWSAIEPTPALPQTRNPTLAPVADDDVIITWTGRLIVVPEETPVVDGQITPPQGLDGPDDQMLVLTGTADRPVIIATPRGDRVTAAAVDYTTQSRRIGVAAGDGMPMQVISPELGELRGTRLHIDQTAGSGYVIGPGDMISVAKQDATKRDDPLAQPMKVAWRDRLDMTFFVDESSDDRKAGSVDALRTAAFAGQVRVNHPQFDVSSEQLAIRLTPPTVADADAGQRQALEQLTAAGDVYINARGNGEDETLAIESQKLAIAMTPTSAGRTQPSQLTATDRVKITRPQQTLWANQLVVGLGVDERDKLKVTTLRAHDDVRVDMTQQGVAALASTLLAKTGPSGGEVELLGDASTMASLMREDGELLGQRIVLFEQSRQAHIPGPGSLTFIANRDGDTQKQTHLNVTWSQSMRFDDRTGTAVFVGDVAATTASQRDRTKFTAQEMRLEFEPASPDADAAKSPEIQPDSVSGLLGGGRQIRQLVAASPTGEAVFLAMSFADGGTDHAHMNNRFRIAGPAIVFNNADERVHVEGKGTMLIEDFEGVTKPDAANQDADVRGSGTSVPVAAAPTTQPTHSEVPIPSAQRPIKSEPKADKQTTSGDVSGGVAVTGKGTTLFTWTGSLVLDAKNNDMIITRDVLMLHRPPADSGVSDVVQLNCDKLVADQESTGGLSVWMAGEAPKPQIKTVKADGAVKIRNDTLTILADHAHFDGGSEWGDIFGDTPKRMVTVVDDNEPLGQLTARKLRWHLPTNRFEVIAPGPGRVPLGIQKRLSNPRK